jgi:soluble lytic murein transglycosylase-like protein
LENGDEGDVRLQDRCLSLAVARDLPVTGMPPVLPPVLALALSALCALPAARADILVREDAQDGIVLSNEHAPAPPPAQALAAARARTAAKASLPAAGPRARQFAPLVRAAAHAHGLPEALLQAVVETESGFNAGAVSPKGAVGLMQLMPQTARDLRVKDARDPADNLDGGARYLKQLLALHGNDLSLALAAYNAGPGAVQRTGGIPPFAETQRYVPRVISRFHSLQSQKSD